MFPILLTAVAVICRFLPHEPNFTPLVALSLFAAANIQNKRLAVTVPLLMIVLSDLVIGLHSVIAYTWTSVLLITLLGLHNRQKAGAIRFLGKGVLASILFFVITNFGVWMTYYPKTFSWLMECYTLAIPFYRNTLISTMLYSSVLLLALRTIPSFLNRKVAFQE